MGSKTPLIIGCLITLGSLQVQAFKLDKGQNCMSCHVLERSEAEKILEKAAPGSTILGIEAAPMKGAWQINLQKGERRGAILLDFSKKFLIPQLIPVAPAGNPARQVDVAKISLADAVVLGAPAANKKVIVFTNPDCPFCRELHRTMQQVIAKRKDIAFYLMLIPLSDYPDASRKVQAILCSKSLAMLNDAFSDREVPAPSCPPAVMERNQTLAFSLHVQGTPSLVRSDGAVLSGAKSEDELLNWIDH